MGNRFGHQTSIRVPVETLDYLMNLTGELVLGRNQLVQSSAGQNNSEMDTIANRIDRVTSELQDAIMKTRMQPVGAVFQRYQRLVRDLSAKLNKKCRLLLSGQEVEVDKTIIEAISDPLTHLVRNSVDHGIELPNERDEFGKDEEGEIQLIARRVSGKLEIELRDDGRGIDTEKVKQTAVCRGLISEEVAKTLPDRDAMRLIFAPGFSTVDSVSNVSGRGVGMDVVRNNIERLGGTVEVDSELKLGASIRLTLPLTLAIVPSLIVGQAGAKFAIPQINIRELVRFRRTEYSARIRKVNQAEVLRIRGKLLPLVRLGETLGLTDNNTAQPASSFVNIVVVEMGGQRYGLVVDKLHDTEEIVVKPLGRFLKSTPCLGGATVLGDGKVALILDIPGIASRLKLNASRRLTSKRRAPAQVNQKQSVVVFENGANEWFAVPMALVSRIERVAEERIQNIGGVEVVQYHGGTLPLLSLEKHITASPRVPTDELYVIVYNIFDSEFGLIAPGTLDAVEVDGEIDLTTTCEPGVMGSFAVKNRMARLVDLYQLARIAFPNKSATDLCCPQSVDDARVLVVESSPFVRNHLMQLVKEIGVEVFAAEDGEEAWNSIVSDKIKPNLVITNIEVPLLDGIQLCRRIKSCEKTKHLPVIAVSSVTNEETIQRALASGIDECLVKLDGELIENAIRKGLSGHAKGSRSEKGKGI